MPLPNAADIEAFEERVGEVSLLVEGLRSGTLSADYVGARETRCRTNYSMSVTFYNDLKTHSCDAVRYSCLGCLCGMPNFTVLLDLAHTPCKFYLLPPHTQAAFFRRS